METKYVEAEGKTFLKEAVALMGDGVAEDVLRHALSAKLPQMFPEQPWWTKAHVTGTEALAKFHEHGGKKHGFVDVLVGSTVIEYERDLRVLGAFEHGLHQVKQYCASQLNKGTTPDLLVGVLSDTVRWHAFGVIAVKPITAVAGAATFGPEHIELREIDCCDLSAAGDVEAKKLRDFLVRHLGREGGRLLAAFTLAKDLGFESPFCQWHLQAIAKLVDAAFVGDPKYADLITKLWTNFVSYLGGDAAAGKFDKGSYVGELYILTLAKLICANVLGGRAQVSDDAELRSILDGSFFKARGLPNLVEYDYFGWLNASPHVTDLVEVARAIQDDLRAYDFKSSPAEDLFGTLMAQLAARSQRLLLGQEWTPSWLAEKLVSNVMATLPDGEQPRFVDMCCGSGAMVVETVKRAQQHLIAAGRSPGDPTALGELANSITAFDIDPLAVMLAKVGWVLASKDWLVAGHEAQIPVYHADSLFANTPVTKVFSAAGQEHRKLQLHNEEVDLPHFLIKAGAQSLFDSLLSRGYEMAMSSAEAAATTLVAQDIETMVDTVVVDTGSILSAEERASAIEFCKMLLRALENLQRAGQNGIWAFVLRNSFRPALVAGRFNGVVTNPPWLALSKIASNPYQDALKAKAESYGIKAPGASHLHVEMATIFLLHAVERYLIPNAVIGCVLPVTVLNGAQHEPFRTRGYLTADRPIALALSEIWKVASQTFKNEAIVVFGKKAQPAGSVLMLPGKDVSRNAEGSSPYYLVSSAGVTAWTNTPPATTATVVAVQSSVGPKFRQGADVMPRGAVFHAATKNGAAWNLGPIAPGSPFHFLRSDGHVLKDFKLTAHGVNDQVMFDVLLSKHLAPFELAAGAKAMLPIRRGASGWEARTGPGIAALGAATSGAIAGALAAVGDSVDEFFDRLQTDRKKLTAQGWTDDEWIVFASAGGKIPTAAYVRGADIPCSRTVVDQTLYWGRASTEDEAIYIAGLMNSPAVMEVIQAHQPKGAFGERHIHKLAFDRTPAFNAGDPKHIAVVAATRALLADWGTLRTLPTMQAWLAPQAHMITRRKKIRQALVHLPAWPAYVAAARALYGV
ncbi:hypothetical protein [Piscinibacter sakaiensis]|uniref:hypothetical protein n=1 Tax=Piscinibacter sakaiensis TaxID=1547922 RepID=UPI003AAB7B1B